MCAVALEMSYTVALLCPASMAADRAFAAGHITEPDPEWEGAAHFALGDNLIAPGYHIKDSLATLRPGGSLGHHPSSHAHILGTAGNRHEALWT